jgi:hypothetical protein
MTPKSETALSTFLEEKEITRSPREVGIGAQLTSERHTTRIVNIHFLEDESDEYLSRILGVLFSLEGAWIIFPRYGKPADFLDVSNTQEAAAVFISAEDVPGLLSPLVSLQQSLKVIDHDPYLISGSGEILATWDHHVFSDGFSVRFSNVPKSTQFISRLNEVGAEFEVFYAQP